MFNKIYEKIKEFIIENKYFLIFLICFAVFLNYRLDYVIYTPGGYINLNERIEIEDEYETSGTFNMTYVSMVYATPATYLLSFIIPNWDIEDIANITLEDQTLAELEEYQTLNMKSSLDIATIVAYQKAGIGIDNIEAVINIMYIESEAITDLEVGDIILKIGDIENPSFDQISEYISQKNVGDTIEITVLRDEEEVITSSTLIELYEKTLIGISFITTYTYDLEKDLEYEDKNGESGPSGGFMMSLAIYNSLVEEDLSNGLTIIGTGTIDIDGNVGEIDGIKYKLLGSEDSDIFFCSEANYEEATSVIEEFEIEINLVMVKTLDEAIEYLENYK